MSWHPHLSNTKKRIYPRAAAFSLIEVLVAAVILMIMLLIVTGLVNNTSELTKLSNRKINTDAAGRQMLDRISSDLRSAVIRDDLPIRLNKQPGNDALTFYSQRNGYEGDRGVSQVSYGIENDMMMRGAVGTYWEGSAEQKQVGFKTTNLLPLADMESEIISADIFRFEMAFLMKDRTIKASLPNGTTVANDVSAIIIGIAALDTSSRKTMSTDMTAVAELFPDAQDGQDISGLWDEAMTASVLTTGTLPPPVRAAIRIYQRYYFLSR